jgi:putative ubiquitin-RnfH superfamily antitoxin RatB of RatAB toxin-antitoxin module
MNVGVACATPTHQVWLRFEVPDGSTVREVVERSGILEQFPEIDLASHKVGIFGQVARLDKVVSEGDRIELYRPITADPDLVELHEERHR